MKLKFTSNKTKTNEVEYKFSISIENLNEAKDIAYDKNFKEDFAAKGFRKGQAPRSLYEKVKGYEQLQIEAMQVLAENCFAEVLKKKEYVVVGHPSVDIDKKLLAAGNIILSPFEIILHVPIKPDFTLGKYKKIEVKGKTLKVSQKQVKEEIDRELSSKTFLKPKKEGIAVERGDTAIINFEGFKDGVAFEGGKAENFSLKIGSGQFIPGFEDQIIGKNTNDEFDVNVTFPSEYFEKSLAGKPVVFKVKILDIKVEEKPKLTDDFVKGLKIKSVNTKDEYQQHVEKNILQRLEKEEKERLTTEILDKICQDTKIDIHPAMLEYFVMQQLENEKQTAKQYNIPFDQFLSYLGQTEEQFVEKLRKDSENNVKKQLVITEIIKVENLTPSKEELDKKYDEIAKSIGKTPAEAKKQYPIENLEMQMAAERVFDFIFKNAKVIKEEK